HQAAARRGRGGAGGSAPPGVRRAARRAASCTDPPPGDRGADPALAAAVGVRTRGVGAAAASRRALPAGARAAAAIPGAGEAVVTAGAHPEPLYPGWQYATPHEDPGPPPRPQVTEERQAGPHRVA